MGLSRNLKTIYSYKITPAFKKTHSPLLQSLLTPPHETSVDSKDEKIELSYGWYLIKRISNDMTSGQAQAAIFCQSPPAATVSSPWGQKATSNVAGPNESYVASLISDVTKDFRDYIFQDRYQKEKGKDDKISEQDIQLLARRFLLFILMYWLINLQNTLDEVNLPAEKRSLHTHFINVLKQILHGTNSLFYLCGQEDANPYFIFSAKGATRDLLSCIKAFFCPDPDPVPSSPAAPSKNNLSPAPVADEYPSSRTNAWQCMLEFVAKQPIMEIDYLTMFPNDQAFYSSAKNQSAWVDLFHRIAHSKPQLDEKDPAKSPLEKFYENLVAAKGDAYASSALNNAIAHLRKVADWRPPVPADELPARKNTLYTLIFISKTTVATGKRDKREGEAFLKQKIDNCLTVADLLKVYDDYIDHPMVKNHRWGGNFFPDSKIHFIEFCRAKYDELNRMEQSSIDATRLFGQSAGDMRQRPK